MSGRTLGIVVVIVAVLVLALWWMHSPNSPLRLMHGR
jgi:hypothetical protein